ncbi:hypothetical protein JAAARDRAFT_31617 [Jaapia argillacea MUCL 33604]|uniref:Uncharacterized protein n=1 Tax=Jaapia argillacea MUCL 33604 TaxID=933084 RepID=A0A067Q0P2_9AGAM|nr:hypothetical protein JAAARDRAFT_31617 [Jaapia argillacea MUCL 33604]
MDYPATGTHSSLISPLTGLNLGAFDHLAMPPASTSYAHLDYRKHPRQQAGPHLESYYLPHDFQFSWSLPHAHQHTFHGSAFASPPDTTNHWPWPWAAPPHTSGNFPTHNSWAHCPPRSHFVPENHFPASPADSCITSASDVTASPIPSTHPAIPLLAPKPLPYHSPTFLQFDLPDEDEDLSHPPYIRPAKRKRVEEDSEGASCLHARSKRRASEVTALPWQTRAAPINHSSRRQSLPSTSVTSTRHRR